MPHEHQETKVPVAARKRRCRFGLRTLLVLLVVLAVPCGWIAKERRQSAYEQEIAGQLREQLWSDINLCGFCGSKDEPGEMQQWWESTCLNIFGDRVWSLEFNRYDYCDEAEVTDLSPLSHLSKLKSLSLRSPTITNISPLADVTSLEELELQNVHVNDLFPLIKLINLRELHVQYMAISDISPLAKLTRLTTLELQATQVNDLTPLTTLVNLKDLIIDIAPVHDLSPLARLKGLKRINLSGTLANDEQIAKLKQSLPNCIIATRRNFP